MKKQVRLVLLFALIAAMMIMTAIFASAATIDVAAGGDLATAISNAAAGDTINITGDVTVAKGITLNKNITINGNGHTITFTAVSNINADGSAVTMRDVHAVISYAFNLASGTATIQNATVVVPNDGTSKAAVFYVSGTSNTTISGVTTDGGYMTVAYNAVGTVTVNNSTLGANSGHQYVLASSAAAANATFSMTGGKVSHTTNGALRSSGDMIAFAGYINFSANGTTFASKGDTFYFPGGVNLSLKDCTVTSASGNAIAITSNANNKVLIDGGSVSCKTAGQRGLDAAGGTATIKNVTSWQGTIQIAGGCVVTVESGSFGSGTMAHTSRGNTEILFYMNTAGTLNIEGGTFTTNSTDSTSCILWANDGTANVNVTGGTFTVNGKGIPIRICNAKTLTLSGAKIVNNDSSTYAVQIMGSQSAYTLSDLEIQGGYYGLRIETTQPGTLRNVNIHDTGSYGFNPSNGTRTGTIKLYDCTFTTGGNAAINAAGATLEIYSGTYTATGDKNLIRMGDADVTSHVKIYGGTFKTENASLILFSHSATGTDPYPGSLTISNEKGTVPEFESTGSGAIVYFGSSKTTAMSVTIQGGKFTANNTSDIIYVAATAAQATVTISGGEFTQNGSGFIVGLHNATRFMPTVVISGGNFTSAGACVLASGADIEISNATMTAASAVISMNDNDVTSNVTIKSGTYSATGTGAVISMAQNGYAKKDLPEAASASAYVSGTNCLVGDLVIEGGTFSAENGYVLYFASIKTAAAMSATIKNGSFSGMGESLIHVSSPSPKASLTITGGTFKLLESAKGGAILSTGFYTRTDNDYQYDDQLLIHIPTEATISILGGLFVDQRTGNNQVIDTSVGNAVVTVKNAVLLSSERQPYFHLAASEADSVVMTLRSTVCLYGGVSYYMWMTTPATSATKAPVLDNGAGVRVTAGSEGVRFTSTVPAAVVQLLEQEAATAGETVQYGTLIAPADYVAAARAFTIEALRQHFGDAGVGVAYVDIPAVNSLRISDSGEVSFNGVLVNIQEKNYQRAFAAVSYAKIGDIYYYSEYDPVDNARSMATVAATALKDVGEIGESNASGKLYAYPSVYVPYDGQVGSVYSASVQRALQAYCGLASLSASTVSPSAFAIVYDVATVSPMVEEFTALMARSLGITAINGSITMAQEILIGETDRAETAAALAKISGDGYYVGVINGKIVIVGTSEAMTYQALLAFAEQCGSTSVLIGETIVSDLTVYHANDAYFMFACNRDGNIAYGYHGDYTHQEVKDENGNVTIVPSYKVSFENAAYKEEINYFSVDYPVKAIVDIYSELHGEYCNQSVVIPDLIAAGGLRLHMGLTDSRIATEFQAYLADTYGTEAVNSYGYRIENGEVVIYAYNDTLLREAVALFMADIENLAVKDTNGNISYAVPATLSYTKTAVAKTAWITDAPMPDLELDGSLDLYDGTYQYYYAGEGVNVAAFNAYCAKLADNGYTVYMSNEIEGSYFRTYVNNTKTRMIHVVYAAFAHAETETLYESGASLSSMFSPALRVIVADVDGTHVNLLPTEWVNGTKSYTKKTDTRITSVNIENDSIGNCYVITLEDGTFVVLDGGGGGNYKDSAGLLYNVLKALHTEINGQPSESNPITIAAYVTSHGHDDHSQVFQYFSDTYVEAKYGFFQSTKSYYVKIEAVVANYISDDEAYNCYNPNLSFGHYLGTDSWFRNTSKGSSLFYSTVYTAVPYYKVQTGQKFYIRNVEFEVLYTHGDTYPWGLAYFNNSSTVIRTTIHNGGEIGATVSSVSNSSTDTTAMWLGDLQYRGSQVMRAMYGDYLKSDIVQIAHHSGSGSEGELYQLINAKIVLLPADYDRVKSNFTSSAEIGRVNRAWLDETDWQYIILMDEYNVTFTVNAAGPQMGLNQLVNYADTTDEYSKDSEDGTTLQYGRYIVTRDTIGSSGLRN